MRRFFYVSHLQKHDRIVGKQAEKSIIIITANATMKLTATALCGILWDFCESIF